MTALHVVRETLMNRKQNLSQVLNIFGVIFALTILSPSTVFLKNTGRVAANEKIGFSSYFGGSGFEQIRDIVLDAKGNAYVTGRTSSHDLPTTPGAYQSKYGGGLMNAFVAKIASDGRSVVWCTYLGGSNYDVGYGIGLDKKGNVYVAGRTSSKDFPTTPGVFDRTYNGGRNKGPYFGGDAFVAKLSPDGSHLLYSTYIGGSNDEIARDLAVDPDTGIAYITGATHSKNLPTTRGSFDTKHNIPLWQVFSDKPPPDAYIAKLSEDGSKLLYCTYLGGSTRDNGQGITVDSLGNAYVTGFTASDNFPTTPGAFQRELRGGTDLWIAKISVDGSSLIYSTFLGGSREDGPEHSAIIVDSNGNVIISGFTHSSDFPTTDKAYQRALKGSIDNFIAKLAPNGKALIFSTYFGGSDGWETAFGSPGLDSNGNIYISGATATSDFPVTTDAFGPSNSGEADVFLCKFLPDASELLYSTYIGGAKGDGSRGLAVDYLGNVYVVGQTGSFDLPTTPGSFQTEFRGYGDSFVIKLGTLF
jgi:hypothetical protein